MGGADRRRVKPVSILRLAQLRRLGALQKEKPARHVACWPLWPFLGQ